jgi:hypothetical protein
VTHDDVQAWLDAYVEAWRTYDRDRIGALFADGAEYRYHPWDQPIVGRDAIVASWLAPSDSASSRDDPGTYDAHYAPVAVEDEVAVAAGTSTYFTDASQAVVAQVFHNIFVLQFDGAGRCRAFTEYFVLQK